MVFAYPVAAYALTARRILALRRKCELHRTVVFVHTARAQGAAKPAVAMIAGAVTTHATGITITAESHGGSGLGRAGVLGWQIQS